MTKRPSLHYATIADVRDRLGDRAAAQAERAVDADARRATNEYLKLVMGEQTFREANRMQDDKPRKPRNPRGQHTPGRMNKTEARYAAEILEPMKRNGSVLRYEFDSVKFRLAGAVRCWFMPDFYVVPAIGRPQLHEIKAVWKGHRRAHYEDDARDRVKIFAALHPEFAVTVAAWSYEHKEWVFEYFNTI